MSEIFLIRTLNNIQSIKRISRQTCGINLFAKMLFYVMFSFAKVMIYRLEGCNLCIIKSQRMGGSSQSLGCLVLLCGSRANPYCLEGLKEHLEGAKLWQNTSTYFTPQKPLMQYGFALDPQRSTRQPNDWLLPSTRINFKFLDPPLVVWYQFEGYKL